MDDGTFSRHLDTFKMAAVFHDSENENESSSRHL